MKIKKYIYLHISIIIITIGLFINSFISKNDKLVNKNNNLINKPISIASNINSKDLNNFSKYMFAIMNSDTPTIWKMLEKNEIIGFYNSINNIPDNNYKLLPLDILSIGRFNQALQMVKSNKNSTINSDTNKILIAVDLISRNKLPKVKKILATIKSDLSYAIQSAIYLENNDKKSASKMLDKIFNRMHKIKEVKNYLLNNKIGIKDITSQLLYSIHPNNVEILFLAYHLNKNNFTLNSMILVNLINQKSYKTALWFLSTLDNSEIYDSLRADVYNYLPKDIALNSNILNEMKKNTPYYKYTLAIKSMNNKNYKDSTSFLKQANKDGVFNNSWGYFFKLGISLHQLGKITESEKELKTSIKISNENPDVVNYLSYVQIDNNRNIEENLEKVLNAYKKSKTAYIADSIGWAYYKLGDYNNALLYIEKASEELPLEGVVNSHLADIYIKFGRKAEAIVHWNRIIKLDYDNRNINIKQIKKKLKKALSQ